MGKATGTGTRTPRTDSGWAWVVDFGAFLAYFTTTGYTSSLSVYLTIWMDYFDASAVTAGLVISMTTLMTGIMGPFSGALCTKFGPRVVTMVGGVLFVAGAVMSSQATSIVFLIFSNGFVLAMGSSMSFVAPVHALGLYFEKRFAFAVGLASAGFSAGQLVFPPLVSYLIDIYGWEGSLLVTAAINLHILAAGAVMRPTVRKSRKKKRRHVEVQNGPAQLNGSVSTLENETENGRGIRDSDIAERHRDISVPDEDEIEEIEVNDVTMILVKNCPGHVASAFSDPPESSTVLSCISRIKHFLLHTYGLGRLVRNTSFVLTMVVAFLHGFGRLGIVYIVPRAESVGIDLDISAFLLSIFGIGSFVGRIGHGWFIDKRYITGEMAYALGLFVFCVTVSLMPAFVDFIPLAILALLLGAVAGTASSLVMVIVRAQVHLSDAAEALGIMLLFSSVGNVLGILVSGVAYDNTEQYDIAFFVAGGILLIASLLCVVVHFLQKAKRSKSRVYLPTAFYVKLPMKTTADNEEQAEASVTIEHASNLDGLYNDDAGISNPLFMLGLSGVSTSDEDVARTSNEDHEQPLEPMEENNSIRHRLGQKVDDEMGGIENPLAVDQLDELVGATETDENTLSSERNGRKMGKATGTGTRTPRTDSGWAWVVDFGAFLAYFTSIGYTSSLSVYLTIWMDYFDASAVTAGLVISMTTLMAGIMAMGSSMSFVAPVHALGMYFKNRFAFAVGLASAGFSAGQLVFPPLVSYLIDIYGWEGSVLVTAAINLHLLAAGAVMRPTVRKSRKKKRRNAVVQNGPAQLNEIVSTLENDTENGRGIRDSDSAERHRDISVPDEDEIEEIEVNDVTMILVKNCPGHVASAFFDPPESSTVHFLSCVSRLKHFLLHTYGLGRLVRNTSFVLTMVVAFLHGFGRLGIVYIVPQAESVGIDLDISAFLLSMFGIGSLVGRIGHGWFIDKRYITGEMAYALGLFGFCVTVSLMPAFVDFIPLVILALLLGAVAGMSSSLVMVIVRAQVHQSDAAEALGIMLLFNCVGNVLGILVSGVAYDNTEQYDIAFFVAGGILLIASLLCVVVYFLQKAKRSKSRVYLPTAFYVKLPRKTTADNKEQAEASVTIEHASNLDGLYNDDAGITNPLFMLGLSAVSTSDEDDARTSNEDHEQPLELMEENNSIRHRLVCREEDDEIGGIENPSAFYQLDELVGATVTDENENTYF
ncbi:uncharacterized protein LOC119739095 [Patiria miniata]|uniref:Major facilitator superfamily (MFS) profile domain-containing protein n=1 Tax=Patiria miniata TaxID=46514 RepID=A0A914B2Y1_PATMI|nr:uncharacterized protein LOC119739095 [Patiria miniata]